MAIAGPFVDQERAQSNHVNSSIIAFTAVKKHGTISCKGVTKPSALVKSSPNTNKGK